MGATPREPETTMTTATRTPAEAILEAAAEALAFRIAQAILSLEQALAIGWDLGAAEAEGAAAACWDVAASLGVEDGMNERIAAHGQKLRTAKR